MTAHQLFSARRWTHRKFNSPQHPHRTPDHSRPADMEAYVVMIAAALAFLGAACFIGVAISDIVRGARTYRWHRAEGHVMRSMVAHSAETDGEGTTDLYRAEVHYRYEAAGALRSGCAVSITDPGSPSRERAERRSARYPEGARVTVFYDPSAPDRAVLERGVGSGPLALFAWGGLCLVGGIYIVRVLCGLGGSVPNLIVRMCGGD